MSGQQDFQASRPGIPTERPHTVHSTRVSLSAESSPVEKEDPQRTPRQSLSGVQSLIAAADWHSKYSKPEYSRFIGRPDLEAEFANGWLGGSQAVNLNNPHFPTEESRLAYHRSQRSKKDKFYKPLGGRGFTSFARTPSTMSQGAATSAASSASTLFTQAGTAAGASNAVDAQDPHRKNSLRRRLSKARDTFGNLANGQGSMRRKTGTTPSQTESIDPRMLTQQPQPTSPPKRNGKHGDERPKKFRPAAMLTAADRKDTPAPAYGQAQRTAPPFFVPNGGESARQAAARFNNITSEPSAGQMDTQEDIHARRSRVGSISSAADSGADLSTYARYDTPARDCDGDIQMANADAKSTEKSPSRIDFINGWWGEEAPTTELRVLPTELNLKIFEQLDAKSLVAASAVSRNWRSVATEESVWRAVFLRRWKRETYTDPAPITVGGQGIGQPGVASQQWKKMYKARTELEKQWRMGAEKSGKATYLSGHTDSVYCVQFDEEKIITGSRDRTIRVWDINTMQCLRVIGGPNAKPTPGPKPLRTVDYPSFHSAVASVNGSVYGNSIFETPAEWHDASILCLQYDNEILVTGSSDSDLIVWDIETYQPIKRLRSHIGGVLDVALDAKHIISCSKDSRIIVWDRKTYEPKGTLSGHRGPVNAVQLRGKYLVSASGDGIARLWDIENMKLVKEFSAKERGLAAVEFSEDMKYVLAGGNDHITYKFETETGREVGQFTGHSQLVRSLWLDSANSRVVSGSYDLDLRVYDFETGEQIWRAEEWTTSWMLAAKSDYRRIVATSQDGRVLVIDFGLIKCSRELDGLPIDGVDLLREVPIEKTSAIIFRNPFAPNDS